jgi:hypothetical protein
MLINLISGYFPMHEDPKSRIHRPHPFHHERKAPGPPVKHSTSDQIPMPTEQHLVQATENANAQIHMPVASYLPAGFHDTPLPVGKYYPSNWEQRHEAGEHSQAEDFRPSAGRTLPSHARSDTVVPTQTRTAAAHSPEAETRRKMQQYKRDMVAQAAQALGGATRTGWRPGSGFPPKTNSMGGLRLHNSAPHKPNSPRLQPLGSPGPVTPMELESSSGGYLDKGTGSDRRVRELAAQSRGTFPAYST